MRRYFIAISLVLSLLPGIMCAQTVTNSQRRHINAKVLNLIEDYESYASLYDSDAVYYLSSLFQSMDSPVLCDIIGAPQYQKSIPVSEYVAALTSYSMNTSIVIRDVQKGEMTYSDGLWHIPVTFKKDLSYIDRDGYFFSVSEYHSEEFLVTMTISYDNYNDICLIESIDAELSSRRLFPQGRFYIMNENKTPDKYFNKYFPQLTFGGSEVIYNSYGQAILGGKPSELRDTDVEVICDTLASGFNYDVVTFGFKPVNKRVKLRYGIAPIAYKVNNPYEGVSDKSMAMELGVDFGFTWQMGDASRMGIYMGAGLSMSSLTLTLDKPISYDYHLTVYNPDKRLFEDQTIRYELSSALEKIRYQDFIVPVYLGFDHFLSPRILLSWNLGVKSYIPLGAQTAKPYNVSFSASGSNFTMSEGLKYVEPNVYGKDKNFDMSVMGNIGVDVNLSDNKIFCTFSLGYEHGLTPPVYSSTTDKYFSPQTSGGTGIYPIIYDLYGQNHVPVHSLISGVSFNRRALWISTGLKIKM